MVGGHCNICARSAHEKFATTPILDINHALFTLMIVSGRSILVVAMNKTNSKSIRTDFVATCS